MVTKKTRLMSALMALMMLVTLFAGFVLPVSAVASDYAMPTAPSNLIAYKNRKTSTDVKGANGKINYAITDAEDWSLLALDTNSTTYGTYGKASRRNFAGWAFWFTDDLDFSEYSGTYNGSGVSTSFINRKLFLNVYYKDDSAACFAGEIYGQGHKITNLNLDITSQIDNGNYSYMGMVANGYNTVIRDLTIDSSCSFKYSVGGMTKEWQTGALMGYGQSMTLINCRNEASVEINDLKTDAAAGTITSASTNSTSAFGRQTGALKMVNCSNYGAITANDLSRATGLAEWLGSTATVYNSYNVGTLTSNYTGSSDYTGAFSSSVKDGTAFTATFANNYSVGDSFACGARNYAALAAFGTELDAGADATGELAYLLNANHAGDYGKIYYTMANGKMVKGTSANQTVRVRFNFDGDEKGVAYVNVGASLDMNTAGHGVAEAIYTTTDTAATISGSTIVVNAVPATDLTIDVELTSTALQFDELNDALGFYADKLTESFVNELGETLTATYNEILAEKDNYTSQDEINDAVAELAKFSFKEGAIAPIAYYDLYKNLTKNFSVSSAADFATVAEINGQLTVDHTIYIIKDIDMGGSAAATTAQIGNLKASLIGMKDGVEGAAAEISNIYLASGWLVNYYGKEMKNIIFRDCTATAVGSNQGMIMNQVYGSYEHTFDNISLIDCYATKSASNGMGLLMGRNYQTTKTTFSNIYVEGCTMEDAANNASGNVNIGFIVGNAYSAGPTVMDNVCLKGNTFITDYLDTANGMLVGEISSTGSVFKDIVVVDNEVIYNNVASTISRDVLGVVALYKTGTEITMDNIIFAGTTVTKEVGSTCGTDVTVNALLGLYKDSSNPTVTISNVYTDVANIAIKGGANTDLTMTNAYANAGEAIASGEAAAELNIADVEQVWTMNGTTPEFGDATNKTIKVIAVYKDEEIGVKYANVGEEVDVAEMAGAYANGCSYECNEGEVVNGKITAFAPTNEDKMIIVKIIIAEGAALVAKVTNAKAEIEGFLATYGGAIDNFTEKDVILALPERFEDALELAEGDDEDAAFIALNEVLLAYDELTYEIQGDVPYKYNDLELFDGIKTWAISDEADWRAAVAKGGYSFAGETLTLTADIDMTADGDNSPVLPLSYGNNTTFEGTLDGAGHVFENILVEAAPETHKYYVGLVGYVGPAGVIKNLGIASGDIILNWNLVNLASNSNAMGFGAFAGQSTGKIIRCWNAADVTVVVGDELNYGGKIEAEIIEVSDNGVVELENDISVGGIVGRGLNGSLLDGCYNLGTVTGLYHASGLSDWGQKSGEIYNSYNAGQVISDEEGYVQLVRYNDTNPEEVINGNVYAVGGRFSVVATEYKANTVANSNLLPVVASSGELAYLLNTNMANGSTVYYKVENGKTVFADSEDEQTFRITLKDDDGNVLYAYANGGTVMTIGGETFTVTEDKEIDLMEDLSHSHSLTLKSNLDYASYIWSHLERCDFESQIDGVAVYCTHEDDAMVSCTTEYEYVDGSADETNAHDGRQYCTACDGHRIRPHAASLVTSDVTLDPKCKEEGTLTYTCETCGVMYDEPIPELGHIEVHTPNGDGATHKITCDRTNCTLDEDEACTPDTNGFHETITPGEDNFGEEQATCSLCQGTIVVQLPKLAVLKANAQLTADEKTADVTVSLKNNVAVKELTLTVGYDQTAMSLDSVDAATYGFNAVIEGDENGTAVITLTADADVTDALKDIVKLTFKMVTKDGALFIPNKGYEIDLSVEATNAAGEPVAYKEVVGEFDITLGFEDKAGDLFRDGTLDTRDAMLLMRYYMNTLPEEYENVITEESADLDKTYNNVDLGDGTNTGIINIYDVIHLLRILNGWG